MQQSRMFHSAELSQRDLMREVAAIRLAERAAAGAERRSIVALHPIAAVGSLAHRVALWRRLSARRLAAGAVHGGPAELPATAD